MNPPAPRLRRTDVILVGNQRGGAKNLALYLLKEENERVKKVYRLIFDLTDKDRNRSIVRI
jgi:hypothetical protein